MVWRDTTCSWLSLVLNFLGELSYQQILLSFAAYLSHLYADLHMLGRIISCYLKNLMWAARCMGTGYTFSSWCCLNFQIFVIVIDHLEEGFAFGKFHKLNTFLWFSWVWFCVSITIVQIEFMKILGSDLLYEGHFCV